MKFKCIDYLRNTSKDRVFVFSAFQPLKWNLTPFIYSFVVVFGHQGTLFPENETPAGNFLCPND